MICQDEEVGPWRNPGPGLGIIHKSVLNHMSVIVIFVIFNNNVMVQMLLDFMLPLKGNYYIFC